MVDISVSSHEVTYDEPFCSDCLKAVLSDRYHNLSYIDEVFELYNPRADNASISEQGHCRHKAQRTAIFGSIRETHEMQT